MDPDAKIQIATMGTKLEFSTDGTTWTRVYGLASTPDFGGEPNTIDSTTLDNTEYETNVLGLQPSNVLSYELNMMALVSENKGIHNLTLIQALVDGKTTVTWRLTKASGVKFTYDAIAKLQYNADEQSAIEKFTMYHSLKSKITVDVPTIA
jgi:hypothetical protein